MNRYRKTDFSVGIIQGFRSKLESQIIEREMLHNRNSALVKIEDPLLKEYIAYRYPCISRFKRKASTRDENVLNDGIEVGKKLVISKGITEKKKESGRFLEGKLRGKSLAPESRKDG